MMLFAMIVYIIKQEIKKKYNIKVNLKCSRKMLKNSKSTFGINNDHHDMITKGNNQ